MLEQVNVHVSKQPLQTLRATEQTHERQRKPRGFWYARGDAWWRKLLENDVPPSPSSYRAYSLQWTQPRLLLWSVDAVDPARIVQVYPDQIESFSRHYHATCDGLMWSQVAKDYAGIEFVEYDMHYVDSVRDVLCETLWYDSIDVWSGCVWNFTCLESLCIIEPFPFDYISMP